MRPLSPVDFLDVMVATVDSLGHEFVSAAFGIRRNKARVGLSWPVNPGDESAIYHSVPALSG